jgi:hypothetical protein
MAIATHSTATSKVSSRRHESVRTKDDEVKAWLFSGRRGSAQPGGSPAHATPRIVRRSARGPRRSGSDEVGASCVASSSDRVILWKECPAPHACNLAARRLTARRAKAAPGTPERLSLPCRSISACC